MPGKEKFPLGIKLCTGEGTPNKKLNKLKGQHRLLESIRMQDSKF